MMDILVSGGWFDDSGECWVDRVTPGNRKRLLSFVPPDELRVAGKGFTGITWLGEELLVCSFNAIWRFDRQGRCKGRLHMPHFNDLHGICVEEENRSILVANTGLDSVERIDEDGRWLGRYSLTPPGLEHARFQGEGIAREDLETLSKAGWTTEQQAEVPKVQPASDYYDVAPNLDFSRRRVRDYRHPNHVFLSEEHGPCVTSLLDSSIRSLTTHRKVVETTGPPHDGIQAKNGLWYTTVSGEVVHHPESGPEAVLSLRDGPITGWCRGLVLGDDWGAVGVTAMRGPETRVPWRGGSWDATQTGIVWFDRETGETRHVLDMTDEDRGAKVFALIRDYHHRK